MSDPIAAFLAQQPAMILDGALATELERRGADLTDPLWSAKCLIEQPDLIREVHLDYFKAGADIATTATYQATFEGFRRRGIDDKEAARLMRRAVGLADEAREEFWGIAANHVDRVRPLIAASVGPYGAMLADGSEYRGRYALSDHGLMEFHRPRLQVLAQSGADLLAFETIPCLREALVLARLLEEFPALYCWISFSCKDGEHVSEGERLAECVARLRDFPQIAGVGVNCTAPRHIPALLRQMRGATEKPLAVYPNSGECFDASVKRWTGTARAASFGEQARIWRTEGARLIGGCCRTTPDDIRAVRLSALPNAP